MFSFAARMGAALAFCAAGAAFAQEEDKVGKFEVELGGTLIDLDESIRAIPDISNRDFAAAVSLTAGAEVGAISEVVATATLFSELRAPAMFMEGATLTFSPIRGGGGLTISNTASNFRRQTVTIVHNSEIFTVTANIMQNTVSFSDGNNNIVTVLAGGDALRLYAGISMTTESVNSTLTALSSAQVFRDFEMGSLSRCATETDAVGGVGASGRFYLVDDFVDVSLEGGFYATVQKGVMRLNCQLDGVVFGDVMFNGQRARQTVNAVKSGEWSANSVFMGLRVEDEFGPAHAYFRVGGNYWSREYDLPRDFNINGLHYAVDAGNGRQYYVPAPSFQWTAGEGILSDPKQDGFSSHFAFGIRIGRLSAGWTRNKQDDFRVDAYQFSYIHEF